MKKVLIITYYWPPAGGPGVQRALKFTRFLPRNGWIPIILTVKNGDYPAMDKSLAGPVSDLKVFHTSSIEPFRLYKLFTGRKQDESIPTFVLNQGQSERFSDRLSKWIRANLFIPDARIGWMPFAVQKGMKLIRDENIDLIFSTSPPHSLQLIAGSLAKKSGLPWISDFRDPWTEAFWTSGRLNKFSRWLNNRFESNVFRRADLMVTVSPGLSSFFYNKHQKQSEIIYNGFETLYSDQVKTEKF